MKLFKNSFVIILTIAIILCTGCQTPWFASDRAVEHYAVAISLQAGDFNDDAILELKKAVQLDSDFSLAYSKMGDIYRQQKNYELAAESYESACKLDPWEFNDHYHLGQVYQIMKRFADAIRVLQRACQLKPDNAPAQHTLGVCYYETGDYDKAQMHAEKAAELDPNNFQILATLGDIHSKKGDPYQAINAYKQALEVNPDQPEIMIRLGMVYIQQKRFDPARLILEKAKSIAPGLAKPYVALAYCSLIEGDLTAALKQYNDAVIVQSDYAQAYNGIGATHMMLYLKNPNEKDHAKKALAAWHKSLELDPGQPKINSLVQKYTQQLYPKTQLP